MYCIKLFEALEKRLEERKTLDDIGLELCEGVKYPRDKAMRLIKAHKGEEYLIKNADWLRYDVDHIRNAEGKNRPKILGQPEISATNVTTKPGEIAIMLIAENSLPEGKGIALLGTLNDCGRSLCLLIEPAKQKGFHYMIFADEGSGFDFDDGYVEFGKKAFADAYLDWVLEVYRWTPRGCKWEWISVIIDRLPENPVWSHADEIASWKKKACCDGR